VSGDDGGSGSSGGSQDCASGIGQFIYVISDSNDLYTFDPRQFPNNSAFSLVGHVPCVPKVATSNVNSMAIDRHGLAWVNYDDGEIFTLTTSNPLVCMPTAFQQSASPFSPVLGMGFSSDGPGSNTETLFVSDNGGPGGVCLLPTPGPGCMGLGVGTIELSTMTLSRLQPGTYTGVNAGYNAELTGTGAGDLFGFFTTNPGGLAKISKADGSTPNTMALPTVNASTGGYAFSFWGGDFYFYTSSTTPTTLVTHLQTSTMTLTPAPTPLLYTIVGAGVSTCAPTQPPQ
jgi:hypothetical protein